MVKRKRVDRGGIVPRGLKFQRVRMFNVIPRKRFGTSMLIPGEKKYFSGGGTLLFTNREASAVTDGFTQHHMNVFAKGDRPSIVTGKH